MTSSVSRSADARALLACISRVTEAVANASALDAVLASALDGLEDALGVERSAVLLFDDAGVMRFRAWRGLSEGYRRAVDGHSPWQRDEPLPKPVAIADAATDPSLGALRRAVLAEGIRALVFVPLVSRGELVGKFMLYYGHPYVPADEELELARILASQVGFAIARLLSEARLRASYDELQVVLDSVADGITAQTPEGRVRWANAAAARFVGAPSVEAFLSEPPTALRDRIELFDEHGAPFDWTQLPGRHALEGRSANALVRWRPRGGEERWSTVHASPVLDVEGRVQLAVNVIRDVTEARRDEDARRFLVEASRVLASSLDVDTTVQRVANLAVPRLADWCAIRLVEGEELGFPVVAHRDPDRVRVALELALRYPPDRGADGGSWQVLRTGEPIHVPEVTDADLARSAHDDDHLRLLHGLDVRSYVAVPLRARGHTIGVVTLGHRQPRWFGPRDLDLAMQLGDLAGMAAENARLYRSARIAEQRLVAERERLAVTLRSIAEGVIATDTIGRVILCNGVAERMTGCSQAEALGRPLGDVFPIFGQTSGRRVENPVDVVLRTGQVVGLANHTILRARDGTRRAIAHSAAPIRDEDDEVLGVVLVFRDVTEQHRLEEELARTSKLESLGVLAGGIAHDFNNLLTVVVGNLSLVERKLPAGPLRERIVAASRACERARDLTRQLLTFSRGGAPVRAPLAVGKLVHEAVSFALQGSRSSAVVELDEDVWPIQADAGQVGQVLHNLVLNADQAMPEGGRITVQASNVHVERPVAVPIAPGRYVRIVVADEGPGVPPELAQRIFDPFFTTKAQGSGLGLATAHSIVHRHDGHLSVESAPGGGAAFVIHLPCADDEVASDEPSAEHALPRGRGRVLVMDDDEHVRALAFECLRVLGYRPEVVPDGEQAVARWLEARASEEPFQLAIVDLTVPGRMGGREAIARIHAEDPGARAIVSSGYCNDPVMARYHEHGFAGVIQKPWTLEDLARVVRDVLEPAS